MGRVVGQDQEKANQNDSTNQLLLLLAPGSVVEISQQLSHTMERIARVELDVLAITEHRQRLRVDARGDQRDSRFATTESEPNLLVNVAARRAVGREKDNQSILLRDRTLQVRRERLAGGRVLFVEENANADRLHLRFDTQDEFQVARAMAEEDSVAHQATIPAPGRSIASSRGPAASAMSTELDRSVSKDSKVKDLVLRNQRPQNRTTDPEDRGSLLVGPQARVVANLHGLSAQVESRRRTCAPGTKPWLRAVGGSAHWLGPPSLPVDLSCSSLFSVTGQKCDAELPSGRHHRHRGPATNSIRTRAVVEQQAPMNGQLEAPLTEAIIAAVSRLVDDRDRPRDPSHSAIAAVVAASDLKAVDPARRPQPIGKEKRVRGILDWALTNDAPRGGAFVRKLLAEIRGCGGFRPQSPNFVGEDPIANAIDAFAAAGFLLGSDGDLRPQILTNLEGAATTAALRAYVARIRHGYMDSALVVGTGKDLLEATAAHVLVERYGSEPSPSINFPTLLGQAFTVVGLATPQDPVKSGEPQFRLLERRLFESALVVNALRNRQGSGHGRAFLPSIDPDQARAAAEVMAIVSELLLNALKRP